MKSLPLAYRSGFLGVVWLLAGIVFGLACLPESGTVFFLVYAGVPVLLSLLLAVGYWDCRGRNRRKMRFFSRCTAGFSPFLWFAVHSAWEPPYFSICILLWIVSFCGLWEYGRKDKAIYRPCAKADSLLTMICLRTCEAVMAFVLLVCLQPYFGDTEVFSNFFLWIFVRSLTVPELRFLLFGCSGYICLRLAADQFRLALRVNPH